MSRQISQPTKPAATAAVKAGQGDTPNPNAASAQGEGTSVSLTLEEALAKIAGLEEAGQIATSDLQSLRLQLDATDAALVAEQHKNDELTGERDALADQLAAINTAAATAVLASSQAAAPIEAKPTWRREPPLTKAEAALADKLGVNPDEVFAINLESGTIVTSAGRAVRVDGDA